MRRKTSPFSAAAVSNETVKSEVWATGSTDMADAVNDEPS